ncbi:MAG TPA: hypothetical protein VMR34_03020 [Candidatus Saccharimonadales bacterium]|nr:hypothetical protein [Candidatus Saccharimonadales bacterium]
MKEVIWVFGASASGKETFIKHVTEDGPRKLLKRLGWENKLLACCSESLEYIGGEPSASRERIMDRVPELLQSADVVFIKWQYVDSQANRPQRLKKKLPKIKHRIISLLVSPDELLERLPSKPLWHNYGKERELISIELPLIAQSLRELSDFKTRFISSSKSGKYEVLKTTLV